MALDLVTSGTLCILVVLTSVRVTSVSGTQQDARMGEGSLQSVISQRMHGIQQRLDDVSKELAQFDQDLEKALFNCLGLHQEMCQALESRSRPPAWMPSKRSATGDSKVEIYRGLLNNLKQKRVLLKRLQHMFSEANHAVGAESKRSCSLNLGFHCQTEDISNFADMYDYLSSPMSPGKKRSVRMAERTAQ